MKSVSDVKQENFPNVSLDGSLMNRYPATALLILGLILAASLADGFFLPCFALSSKSQNTAATEPPGLSCKLIKIHSSAQSLELRLEDDPFARVCGYTFGLERLEVTDAYPMSESESGDLWYKISRKSIAAERDAWLRFDSGKMKRLKVFSADLRKAFQDPDPSGRLVYQYGIDDENYLMPNRIEFSLRASEAMGSSMKELWREWKSCRTDVQGDTDSCVAVLIAGRDGKEEYQEPFWNCTLESKGTENANGKPESLFVTITCNDKQVNLAGSRLCYVILSSPMVYSVRYPLKPLNQLHHGSSITATCRWGQAGMLELELQTKYGLRRPRLLLPAGYRHHLNLKEGIQPGKTIVAISLDAERLKRREVTQNEEGRLVVYTQLGDSCSVEFAIPSMPPGPGWLARVVESRLYGIIFALAIIAGAIWFAWYDRPDPMRGERSREEARSVRHRSSALLDRLEALMNRHAPDGAPTGRTTSRGSQPQLIGEDAALDLQAKVQGSTEALSGIKQDLERACIALQVNNNWAWDMDALERWYGDIGKYESAPGKTKSIEATVQYLLKNMDYSSRCLGLLMEGFTQVMGKVLPPQAAQSAEERRSRPGTNRRQDSFLRPLSYGETLICIKEILAQCLQPKPQDLSVPAADIASLLSQMRTASEAIRETVRRLRKENAGLTLQANEQRDALSTLSSELIMYKKNVLLLKQRPRAEDTAIVHGACEGIIAAVDRILATLYSFHSVDPTLGSALRKILERMRHFKVQDYFVWIEAVRAMQEGEAIALTSPKVQRFIHANGKEDTHAFMDGLKQAIFEDCVFNNLDDILIGLEEFKRLHWKLELTNDDALNFPRLTDQLMQLRGALLTSLGKIGCYPIPLEIGASVKELMARSHATQIGEIDGSRSYPLKGTWQTYDLVEINNWAYLSESGKLLGNSKAQVKTHSLH